MMMLVTVTPSIRACSCTAVHSSSSTRSVRVGVLGALGIHILYLNVMTIAVQRNVYVTFIALERTKPRQGASPSKKPFDGALRGSEGVS